MLILGRYLIVFLAAPCVAEANSQPPNWLLGKSVILQYTETRSLDPVEIGLGAAHDDHVESRTKIYISDRARLFAVRQSNVVAFTLKDQPSRSSIRIKSPDVKSEGNDWRFEGDTLYGFIVQGKTQVASVKRIAVSFNRETQTCTPTIGYARPNGSKENITQGWWRGELYYIRSYALTSSSCEIRPGNIFNGAQ
jgi:hypothetical protein